MKKNILIVFLIVTNFLSIYFVEKFKNYTNEAVNLLRESNDLNTKLINQNKIIQNISNEFEIKWRKCLTKNKSR